MAERAIRYETSSGAKEFAQTWSLAIQAFTDESCFTPASVYAYKGDLKNLIKFLQERNVDSWEEIKPGDLLDFFERPQVKSPQKYSPVSTVRYKAVVRGFFEWVKSNTEYPINNQIIETMRSLKWHPENGRRFTADKLLSRSQLSSIATNPDSRNQALIRLLIAGIRQSQLVQLTIQNVKDDLKSPQSRLIIEVPFNKRSRILSIEENADEESSPVKWEVEKSWEKRSIDAKSSLALKKYLLERESEKGAPKSDDPLFTHKCSTGRSEKLTRAGMWMIVSEWGEKIGIPCTPHLLTKSARQLAK